MPPRNKPKKRKASGEEMKTIASKAVKNEKEESKPQEQEQFKSVQKFKKTS